MKKTITYREITIAIGILVAMVVALTLWIRVPGEKLTGASASVGMTLPAALIEVLTTAADMFSEDARAGMDR